MRAYKCKCGNQEWIGSYGPPACLGCEKCGTQCGLDSPPEPHRWVTRYNQNTGKPYEMCMDCMTKRPAEASTL